MHNMLLRLATYLLFFKKKNITPGHNPLFFSFKEDCFEIKALKFDVIAITLNTFSLD